MIVGIPIAFFFGYPRFYMVVLLMLPMVLDGFIQLLTSYESKNWKRLLTGILFGVAFIFALIYFHRGCVRIAGVIMGLLIDDPERVERAMELFL